MRTTLDNPTSALWRTTKFAVAAALLAGLLAFAPAGPATLPTGVARADVIDEYEEPPPPTPEPNPEPPQPGVDKPSNSGGGSGSQSGSPVYSSGTDSTAPAPTPGMEKAVGKEAGKRAVLPERTPSAAIALEPAAADSTFLSAAFGGVGWVLPTLLILIAIGAVVWTRLNRPKVRSSRSPRAEP